MTHTKMKKPFTAAVGFDGYIDRISKVVLQKSENNDDVVYYDNITSFSKELLSMAGLSGDLETVVQEVKIGGNAVNIANGLAVGGAKVTLIATTNHEVFENFHQNVKCYSFGTPGDTLALEFNDGKIMLADTTHMRDAVISAVNSKPICSEIIRAYSSAELCVFANWACMPEMQDLWDIAVKALSSRGDKPCIYLDLADFSKRSDSDVEKLIRSIELLRGDRAYLGLNEKETILLAHHLGYDRNDVIEAAGLIYSSLKIDVITHAIGSCYYAGRSGELAVAGKTALKPVISTGAGDCFSAAWCSAIMWGYDVSAAMNYANNIVYDFVTTGTIEFY